MGASSRKAAHALHSGDLVQLKERVTTSNASGIWKVEHVSMRFPVGIQYYVRLALVHPWNRDETTNIELYEYDSMLIVDPSVLRGDEPQVEDLKAPANVIAPDAVLEGDVIFLSQCDSHDGLGSRVMHHWEVLSAPRIEDTTIMVRLRSEADGHEVDYAFLFRNRVDLIARTSKGDSSFTWTLPEVRQEVRKHQREAWLEGYEAAQEGVPPVNPYIDGVVKPMTLKRGEVFLYEDDRWMALVDAEACTRGGAVLTAVQVDDSNVPMLKPDTEDMIPKTFTSLFQFSSSANIQTVPTEESK